jgi:hypothetical protein
MTTTSLAVLGGIMIGDGGLICFLGTQCFWEFERTRGRLAVLDPPISGLLTLVGLSIAAFGALALAAAVWP